MSINKIILMILFIIPFIFVTGIIASSFEEMIPLASGNNCIWMRKVSVCGRGLKRSSENIVFMEVDIIQKVVVGLYKSRYVRNSSSFNGAKLVSKRDA